MVEKKVSEVTCKARFGFIKESLKNIEDKQDLMLSNHLPHINNELVVHKTYFKLIGFVLGTITVAIIGLFIKLISGVL